MHLFDTIERTHAGPGKHTEDTYSFLNRSAQPASENVRDLLESCFLRYPSDEREELKIKFQSQFDSAFFELFLHELLLRIGAEVSVHPTLPGTESRPDFLARFPRGLEVIVEAVNATDLTDKERANRARLNALFDSVNEKTFSPNFFISFGPIVDRSTVPTPKRIRKFIQEKIANLDPDVVSQGTLIGRALPHWTFRDERGFELEITAIPKTPETRGDLDIRTIGSYPAQARWGDGRMALKKAIDGKAGKYGKQDRPFVVAVNATSDWGMTRGEAAKALYGSKEAGDVSDGVWNATRNTRLSAVLAATVYPWSMHVAPLCLYHNSFAKQPCQEIPWQVAQAVQGESDIQWCDGIQSRELFQLPPDWPGKQRDE